MIIDGRQLAQEKLENLKTRVKELGFTPTLLIVTDVPDSVFVKQKIKNGEETGLKVDVGQEVDLNYDGIIVQLPHPQAEELIAKIPLEKDVDGLKPNSSFLPATVKAIIEMLKQVQHDNGVTYVIVGQGRLVGKPLANYLEKQSQKVIRCDINTVNLKEKTLQADILVTATGVPNLIKKDMVKPGVILIDCGSPKPEIDNGAYALASAYTPVPGGVGPLTVACLLENVVDSIYNRSITHT